MRISDWSSNVGSSDLENELADQVLRHQARIGTVQNHDALLHLARGLSLPETQIWLAHNAPQGQRPGAYARYPMPKWTPDGGWRVDKALAFSHALQASNFRASVVSPAGARGLMKVLPVTTTMIAPIRRACGRAREMQAR